jgi:predicted O-methyltransferase YrrM
MHCLEVGAWEGRSAIYLVENYCNGNRSYVDSVDTWSGSVEHSKSSTDTLYERFIYNLQQHIEEAKVRVNRGYSSDILMKFVQEVRDGSRDQYNLIYIDASHVAKDVLMNSVLAWELLKVGGIMLFDDYKWDHYTKTPPMTPEPAIDGFLASYSTMYKILHKGYQMHIMKTADYPVY